MSTRKRYGGFTIEQHIAAGTCFKTTRKMLFEVLAAYGKSSHEGRAAMSLERRLVQLQGVLDSTVCRETAPPERHDPRNLAVEVYSGRAGALVPTNAPPAVPTDKFAGWARADE